MFNSERSSLIKSKALRGVRSLISSFCRDSKKDFPFEGVGEGCLIQTLCDKGCFSKLKRISLAQEITEGGSPASFATWIP